VIVYPAIDIYEGRAVRMTRGDFATVEQVAASPLEAARKLVAEGAEWLHVIDLDGSRTGKPENLDHTRAIANRFTVRIQAGGGAHAGARAARGSHGQLGECRHRRDTPGP